MKNTLPQPVIRYYCCFELRTDKKLKHPKYSIVRQAGYYHPMNELTGRDGQISLTLVPASKSGSKADGMKLQGKNSLNFTGLNEYFKDGKLSGLAWGNPQGGKEYGRKKKHANPFDGYEEDAFLFIMHQGAAATGTPPQFMELVVLANAKIFAESYIKQLEVGGFDEELRAMRKLAGVEGVM